MIRRNGIILCWQCSVCFVMAITLVGCDQSSPVAAPTSKTTPKIAELNQEASAEPKPQVAAPATASAAEVAGANTPAAVEQAPAKTDQKPLVPAPTPKPGAPRTPKAALSVPEPPDFVYEPRVLMSQRDADSCLVKVGETFPMGQLSDLEGQEHSLKELLGEKATVIVFWANSNRLGREQIQRLEVETVAPFRNTGLSVVAINISDPPEQIRDLLPADSELGYTVLLDTNAKLFSEVATGGQPRTYLLDASGKVLWCDIEYSRGMARDLVNAIHVYLGGRKPGDS